MNQYKYVITISNSYIYQCQRIVNYNYYVTYNMECKMEVRTLNNGMPCNW